jgi:hypothetical protein
MQHPHSARGSPWMQAKLELKSLPRRASPQHVRPPVTVDRRQSAAVWRYRHRFAVNPGHERVAPAAPRGHDLARVLDGLGVSGVAT